MKTVGVIRKFDMLGRIVVPKEIRDFLEIDDKTPVEISLNGNDIVLRKQENTCIFCGSAHNLNRYAGKYVCEHCSKQISKEKEPWG